MELAVRHQVKIILIQSEWNCPVFLGDFWAQSMSACGFFERHETCDHEQSERHRAQLWRHTHDQLLCVRPARSFTRGNNPGQTRQIPALCELGRSDIIITLFQHEFLSSNLWEIFCFSQAVDTQTENNQTTSTFSLEKTTLSAAGRWLCQVKTKTFLEEKEFMVNVKGEILQPSPFLYRQRSKQS